MGRVHAVGQVPNPLPPDAPGDRNLAAHQQELQHLGDVAVVRPPGRGPWHDTCVRDIARSQRPGAAEQVEDVAAETVVGAEPVPLLLVYRPVGRTGEVQTEVGHRPHQRVVLEQRPVLLERMLEVLEPVGRPEPAPGDEVRARRDRRGRVDLQQRQAPHDLEQVGRPGSVEQLRAYSDAPGLRLRESFHTSPIRIG